MFVKKPQIVLCLAITALTGAAQAVQVAWSVDLLQNRFTPCADDFHVWGVIQSNPNPNATPNPPLVSEHDNVTPTSPESGTMSCGTGEMTTFTTQIGGAPNFSPPTGYTGPWPPVGPYYYFEANWSGNCVELGQSAHFGLKFDVNGSNYAYWLQGMWTGGNCPCNSTPVTGSLSAVPMLGFTVNDTGSPYLRLQNATTVPLQLDQMQMTLMPVGTNLPVESLCNSFFDIYTEITWSPVPVGAGGIAPQYLAPDSFFDVFLEMTPGLLPGGSQLQTGQVLLARQKLTYTDQDGQHSFWQYQMHEVTAVPEPAAWMLLLLGGACALRRRRA